jgi:hypothetical protein
MTNDNTFDDFDTTITAEEFYDHDDVAMDYDTGSPIDTDRMARESALMDGKYHGPSNSPGLTSREYWESWAEEQDERNDW